MLGDDAQVLQSCGQAIDGVLKDWWQHGGEFLEPLGHRW